MLFVVRNDEGNAKGERILAFAVVFDFDIGDRDDKAVAVVFRFCDRFTQGIHDRKAAHITDQYLRFVRRDKDCFDGLAVFRWEEGIGRAGWSDHLVAAADAEACKNIAGIGCGVKFHAAGGVDIR